MKIDYQSIFVAAREIPSAKFGYKNYNHEVNGVEFTRDVQSTIDKMSDAGYQLFQAIPLISSKYYSKTYTEGVTLIFQKAISE